jgi:hypothetical protein
MSCENAYFNGWGECAELLKKMNGSGLQIKGNTWTDDTAITEATWRLAIASEDSAVRNTLMIPINAFVNTTDDANIVTSALGKKFLDGKPIPSGILQLDASICDYKYLHSLVGKWFEFIPFFEGGSYWLTRKSDGTLKGFRCKIDTIAGLPPEDKLNSFQMFLFFDSYEEFKNVVLVTPDFSFNDLSNYSPNGLNVSIVTAYTAGVVVLDVTKRGSNNPMTGLSLETTDGEVMNSKGKPIVAITAATEDGQGQYTATIKTDSAVAPTNMTASEYAVIQIHKGDGTHLSHLSHSIKIVGGA